MSRPAKFISPDKRAVMHFGSQSACSTLLALSTPCDAIAIAVFLAILMDSGVAGFPLICAPGSFRAIAIAEDMFVSTSASLHEGRPSHALRKGARAILKICTEVA